VAFFIITSIRQWHSTQQVLLYASSALWGALICICLWPPVAEMIPDRHVDERGWQILWRPLEGMPLSGKRTVVKPGPLSPKRAPTEDASRRLPPLPQGSAAALAPLEPRHQQAPSPGEELDQLESLTLLPSDTQLSARVPDSHGPFSSRMSKRKTMTVSLRRGPDQNPYEVLVPEFSPDGLEPSIMAVPSFERREAPRGNLAFQLISVFMVLSLVGAAVVDYLMSIDAIVLPSLNGKP
jgi:hypothetical protein